MDVKCPACGGADVRRFPLVWKEVEDGARPSPEVLAAVMVQAHPKARAATSLTDEDLHQLLAEEIGPPAKLADPAAAGACLGMAGRILLFACGLVLLILGVVRLAAANLQPGRIITTLLGALVLAAVMFMFLRVVAPKPTFEEYEKRLVAWGGMFLCIQCGNRFGQDV